MHVGPVVSGTLCAQARRRCVPKSAGRCCRWPRAGPGGAPRSAAAQHRGAHRRRSGDLRRVRGALAEQALTWRGASRAPRSSSRPAPSPSAASRARNGTWLAEGQCEEARARLATARKTLGDATVSRRSPASIASAPSTPATSSPRAPSCTPIVDPSSIQLEASVPSESLGAVRVGAAVSFEVRGYPDQTFDGQGRAHQPDRRSGDAAGADLGDVDNRSGRLVAGLFADGRVTQGARRA